MAEASIRHLVIALGDQLDHRASGFKGLEPAQDPMWMAELAEESRSALFLSAMRHYAPELSIGVHVRQHNKARNSDQAVV
jgi:deoxyribodipyrimidine photolyase-related protein